MLSSICFSKPKISIDKTYDGVRVIQTERSPSVFNQNGTLNDCSISLTCIKHIQEDSLEWIIRVYIYDGNVQIKKNNIFLLKFNNNDILTLYADDNYSPDVTSVSQNVFGALLNKSYIVAPNYIISYDNLMKVINSSVQKVRVETYDGQFDGNVYGNKFTEYIKENYLLIKDMLKQNKSIYDDF